jgi:hypothetical protein
MKRQRVIALLALGWTFRRIERETGVRRETVSKHGRPAAPDAAKVFPGADGPLGPVEGLPLDGGKAAHVDADLGENVFGSAEADTGDLME